MLISQGCVLCVLGGGFIVDQARSLSHCSHTNQVSTAQDKIGILANQRAFVSVYIYIYIYIYIYTHTHIHAIHTSLTVIFLTWWHTARSASISMRNSECESSFVKLGAPFAGERHADAWSRGCVSDTRSCASICACVRITSCVSRCGHVSHVRAQVPLKCTCWRTGINRVVINQKDDTNIMRI
jgi:hypothetical protein